MATRSIIIKVKIKDEDNGKPSQLSPAAIDREIRTLLRDNLESAVEDKLNCLTCNYLYETDLIKLRIEHV